MLRGNLYFKAMKINNAIFLKKLSWKREKFDNQYRMTQAGYSMILKNVKIIYNTKDISKFEGEEMSRYSREHFASGVNVSTESCIIS
jgi:hypothetical protein